jgi:hypothetical protein
MDAEHRVFWTLISLASIGGALFACFVSLVWHSVLGAEIWFIVIALAGVPPTFVALAGSIDGRGHPLRWLSASATVYVVWYILAFGLSS